MLGFNKTGGSAIFPERLALSKCMRKDYSFSVVVGNTTHYQRPTIRVGSLVLKMYSAAASWHKLNRPWEGRAGEQTFPTLRKPP